MVTEKLRNMMLAHQDGVYKFSARDNCDELVTEIIKENLVLREALYPRPEIKDCPPLILYFGTDQDRDEFIELVQQAKPGMRSHKI